MLKSSLPVIASAFFACASLAACAGPQPVRYSGIAASPFLQPNDGSEDGKVSYDYESAANWGSYSNAIVEPVQIYCGSDNQFGKLSEASKVELARYMQVKFTDAIKKRFAIASTPSDSTLRVKLTLTGASGTNFIGKFAHIDMGGNVYNGIQAVRGAPGLASGWVMYSVQVEDATTGLLLAAYEVKEFPNAFNINAAFGSLAAAKIGIDKGAELLVAEAQ